jgi:hypothetical protein
MSYAGPIRPFAAVKECDPFLGLTGSAGDEVGMTARDPMRKSWPRSAESGEGPACPWVW